MCRKGLWLEDEIPDFHPTRRRAWLYDLLKISQVAIERCVKPVESSDNALCQIHHFCDASQEACGPLLGQVHFLFFFLGSPAWLLSLKEKTIPRLELTADTVSVRLNKILTKKLELSIDRFTFWTDSMTVIRYIANESKRFHTYVANRIAVREESNPFHWKCIMTASPIPLMKFHQELEQTRSFATAFG